MSWLLIVKPAAEKSLESLPKPMQRRISGKLVQVEADPRMHGAVKLEGTKATYRVRVGDYRIVYEIDDTERRIFVTIIAHRKEVYRGL